MNMSHLIGKWNSRYVYKDKLSSQHVLNFTKREDNMLIGQGSDENGAQLVLKLEYDPENNILTGAWHETTSLTGYYQGIEFHGAVQFILNADFNSAEGMWVGFDTARDRLNTGEWWLTKKQN